MKLYAFRHLKKNVADIQSQNNTLSKKALLVYVQNLTANDQVWEEVGSNKTLLQIWIWSKQEKRDKTRCFDCQQLISSWFSQYLPN